MKNERRMPDQVRLGEHYNSTMIMAMQFGTDPLSNPLGLRTVMGMILPEWQRPFVWTDAQCVSFIESAWKGIPLGTYTLNMRMGSRFDGWLIDGQQRMRAIERYLANEFPVFGYRWSEVTDVDRRVWELSIQFGMYETRSDNEEYLKSYYNLMNFGGTQHKASEVAV